MRAAEGARDLTNRIYPGCSTGMERTMGVETSTWATKKGLAQMLKGGVIMDVVTAEHAKIAEEAGACAVCLLLDGTRGVTVTGYSQGVIHYMPIKEAIKQRHVDLAQVSLYEQLGFTFGRVRQEFAYKRKEEAGEIARVY